MSLFSSLPGGRILFSGLWWAPNGWWRAWQLLGRYSDVKFKSSRRPTWTGEVLIVHRQWLSCCVVVLTRYSRDHLLKTSTCVSKVQLLCIFRHFWLNDLPISARDQDAGLFALLAMAIWNWPVGLLNESLDNRIIVVFIVSYTLININI